MATPLMTTLTCATLVSVSAGLAFYYWRRSQGLYSLLLEGANRYEELRQRLGVQELHAQKAEQKAARERETLTQADKALQEARSKNAKLIQELQGKELELSSVRERFEAQRGHLERHLTKVTQDLQAAEAAKSQIEERLRAEIASLSAHLKGTQLEAEKKLNAVHLELSLRDRDVHLKMQELEKEKNALEKKAKAADLLEVKKLKRKLGGYERLYLSMKSLRDMMDERNRNWEVALRKLSTYIVTAKHGPKSSVPEAIGPLVGEALELIGAQLVHDHVDFSPMADHASVQKAEADIAAFAMETQEGAASEIEHS